MSSAPMPWDPVMIPQQIPALSSLRRYGRTSWTHVVKRTFWNVRCGIILFSSFLFFVNYRQLVCMMDDIECEPFFKVPRCSQSCPFPPWRAECIFSNFWHAFLGGPESFFGKWKKRIGNIFVAPLPLKMWDLLLSKTGSCQVNNAAMLLKTDTESPILLDTESPILSPSIR